MPPVLHPPTRPPARPAPARALAVRACDTFATVAEASAAPAAAREEWNHDRSDAQPLPPARRARIGRRTSVFLQAGAGGQPLPCRMLVFRQGSWTLPSARAGESLHHTKSIDWAFIYLGSVVHPCFRPCRTSATSTEAALSIGVNGSEKSPVLHALWIAPPDGAAIRKFKRSYRAWRRASATAAPARCCRH